MERQTEESSARDFRERVLAADAEAQKNVAPFLENPVLRRIIKTFTNDERGDFAKWACNPRVLEMLRRAQKAMDEGKLTEAEAERVMIESVAAKQKSAYDDADAEVDDRGFGTAPSTVPTGRKVRVETNNLVSALNEHVQLRMQGNQLYESRAFLEALEKYQAALSVVDLIQGTNPGDQGEIDKNRAATLMNVAATHMGMQAFGEAIRNLNEANRIVPNHPKLLMRRARAFTQRGAFDEARADVRACAAQNVLSAREMHAARAEVDAAEREVRVRFLPVSSLALVLAKSRRRLLRRRLLRRVSTLTRSSSSPRAPFRAYARSADARRRCAPSALWRGGRCKSEASGTRHVHKTTRDARIDATPFRRVSRQMKRSSRQSRARSASRGTHRRSLGRIVLPLYLTAAALASSTMRLAASAPYCCSYANSSMAASGSSGGGASFSSASVGMPSGLGRVFRTLSGSSHEISSASTPKNALSMGTDASSASSSVASVAFAAFGPVSRKRGAEVRVAAAPDTDAGRRSSVDDFEASDARASSLRRILSSPRAFGFVG